MTGDSHRIARLAVATLVASLLVSGVAAGIVLGQEETGTSADDANSTAPADTGPYSLEELQQGGAHVSGAPPSVRWYGEHGQLWLRHVQTSVFDVFLDDSDLTAYVSPGQLVKRDYVYLEGVRGRNAGRESLDMTVVYWDKESTENGTFAVNQRIDKKNVELPGGGYDQARINLRDSRENATHVTMWIDGSQGTLQWTFKQKSSAATAAFPTDSRGDFALYGFAYYLLTVFLTTGGLAIATYKPLKNAGAPPGYSPALYIGGVLFAVFLVALFAWDWFREVISTAPWLLAVLVGVFIYIIFVETFLDDSRRALFFQLHTTESVDEDNGWGKIPFSSRSKRLVDLENDHTGVVQKGIRPFISRLLGATPVLDTGDTPKTELPGKSGPYSEAYLVNPNAEEVLDYNPEGWMLDVIEERNLDEVNGAVDQLLNRIPKVNAFRVLGSLALLPVGWVLGSEVVASGLIGLTLAALAGLVICSRPVRGRARVDLAPAMFDDVLANVVQTHKGLEEAADRDHYRTKFHEELGSNHAKRKSDRESEESNVYGSIVEERGADENGTDKEAADD